VCVAAADDDDRTRRAAAAGYDDDVSVERMVRRGSMRAGSMRSKRNQRHRTEDEMQGIPLFDE
jgi:hypothetical protein